MRPLALAVLVNRRRCARRLLRRRARSARTGRRRRAAHHAQFDRDHAGDRDPDDPRHARHGLLVSRVQHARTLHAGFRLFRPSRAAGLVDPDHDRDSGGRRRLGRLIRPRSAQADRLGGKAGQGSSRLARLEMAVHLSRPRHCDRQSADHPRGHADQLRTDLFRGHEQLLRAAARRPDLHDGRDGDAPASAGRPCRDLPGMSANYSGAGFSDMRFNVDAVPAEKFAQWVAATRTSGPVLDAQSYADVGKAEPSGRAFHLSCRGSRPVQRHLEQRWHAMQSGDPLCSHRLASQRAEK